MFGLTKVDYTIIILLSLTLIAGAIVDYFQPFQRPFVADKQTQQELIEFREKFQTRYKKRALTEQQKTAFDSTTKIDINKADQTSWELLPKIGPVLARRIVEYRELHGPFRSIDQLIEVKGIGIKTLAVIRPYLVI